MRFFDKQALETFYFNVYCLVYDFFLFGSSKLDTSRNDQKKKERKIYKDYRKYYFKINLFNIFKNFQLLTLDKFVAIIIAKQYENTIYKNPMFRTYFRVLSNNKGFYLNFSVFNTKNNIYKFFINTCYSIFSLIWKSVRLWIVIILLFLIIYFTLVIRVLPFNKIIFAWIGILMFAYWLISGFVFFIKKYQFGKYTTAIQRFWRRSYILFWLLEGATFSVFLYLTINASQESIYMFDQISFYKTHLFSWKIFLYRLFPLVILILLTYLLLISLKWNILNKHIFFLTIITLLLTYIVWNEFYQFFHILNFYGNLNWIYDIDEHVWSLEQEPRRTRIVNHYIMLLSILKFWHIIFIYGFWVFFLLRTLEIGRIRYPMLSANFNNFIILYIFAWVFMYPWFKIFFKNYLYSPYTWFYINNRKLFLRVLFNDVKVVYYGFINFFNLYKYNFLKFFNYDFYYFSIINSSNNYEAYRNNIIKNRVIKILTK